MYSFAKELRKVCRRGYLYSLKKLISPGASKVKYIAECFHAAVIGGHFNIVEYFVEDGIDLKEHGERALHTACSHGHVRIIKYLISIHTELKESYSSALETACSNGQLDVTKFLISKVAYVKLNRLLRMACEFDHLDIIKYLVSQGADVGVWNNTAIAVAASKGNVEIAKFLVESGADVKADRNWAIRYASRNGHLKMVKYLASVGADVRDLKDWALTYASAGGHLEVVKYLVSKGAIIDRCTIKEVVTEERYEVLKYFISIGVDVTFEKSVLIKRAILRNDMKIFDLLISAGCDVDRAIKFAAKYAGVEQIRYLVNIGVDPDEIVEEAMGYGTFDAAYTTIIKFFKFKRKECILLMFLNKTRVMHKDLFHMVWSLMIGNIKYYDSARLTK